MTPYFKKIFDRVLQPDPSVFDDSSVNTELPLPTIWLLGKTGAGKSSLIQHLTQDTSAEIGNGFSACTKHSREYAFPNDAPLMRFLDTRGLGETHYDPTEDIQQCQNSSHVIIVLSRLDDPLQGEIAETLGKVHTSSAETPILIAHTACDLITSTDELRRARHGNQQLFEQRLKQPLPFVELSLLPSAAFNDSGLDTLLDWLAQSLPHVALAMRQEKARDHEKAAFLQLRPTVIRYASSAGAADVTPLLGALATPAIQANLLRTLGNHYDLPWDRQRLKEFSVALGIGVLARFGGSYVARQAAKLIPAYGQTLGAIASGTISFSSTYALGRAAAYYLFHKRQGKTVNPMDVRAHYKAALAMSNTPSKSPTTDLKK